MSTKTTFQTRYFSSDERFRIEGLLLKVVDSFYCDITTVICDYVKLSLRKGEIIDIFDEIGMWRTGFVVSVQANYVGVHYHQFSCNYDDWIRFDSLRLAPLRTYSLYSNLSSTSRYLSDLTVGRFEWCQKVYYEFLLQLSFNFICPTELWIEIINLSRRYYKDKSSDTTPIKDVLRNTKGLFIVSYQHTSLLQDYLADHSLYLPIALEKDYNRERLEEQAKKCIDGWKFPYI